MPHSYGTYSVYQALHNSKMYVSFIIIAKRTMQCYSTSLTALTDVIYTVSQQSYQRYPNVLYNATQHLYQHYTNVSYDVTQHFYQRYLSILYGFT